MSTKQTTESSSILVGGDERRYNRPWVLCFSLNPETEGKHNFLDIEVTQTQLNDLAQSLDSKRTDKK